MVGQTRESSATFGNVDNSEGGPAVGAEAHDAGRDSAAGLGMTRGGGLESRRQGKRHEVRQGRRVWVAGLLAGRAYHVGRGAPELG